jgi:hypothetical protein
MPNRKQKDCSKGKIYFIRSNNPEIKSKYVGSTIQTLAQRMTGHRANYKAWLKGKCSACTIFYEFQKYGIQQFHIELIEDYPCEREEQLLARENFFIRQEECVNKIMAILTPEERKEENKAKCKQYYQEHKEEQNNRCKQYHQEHKEEIKQYLKQYHQEHKEEQNNRHKEYNQEHKEEIKEYLKQYRLEHKEEISIENKKLVTCVCGCEIQQCSLTRHLKSNRHKSLMCV